jgi:3-methyladenine DNA glycosylase AlkD
MQLISTKIINPSKSKMEITRFYFFPFYTIDILASIMVVCKIDPKFIPLYTDKTSTFVTINKWNMITVRIMHNDH